jgi:excisionase family DNA binding protein
MEGRVRIWHASELLGVSPWTVRLRIRQGRLAAHKDGSCVVIERAEIQRYIEENKKRNEIGGRRDR